MSFSLLLPFLIFLQLLLLASIVVAVLIPLRSRTNKSPRKR